MVLPIKRNDVPAISPKAGEPPENPANVFQVRRGFWWINKLEVFFFPPETVENFETGRDERVP